MSTRNKTAVALVFTVIVLFIILILFATFTMKSIDSAGSRFSSSKLKDGIAVVEISGVIMESKDIVKKMLKAEEGKPKVIIMRINSPGGAVGPVQEIYHEVLRIDKKIPVYASFGSIAASGGYYIGAGCREIYSNGGTLTGSIGVIMSLMNLSKLYEFAKVKPNILKAGKYKDIGSAARDMTEEERMIMQKSLSGTHMQFITDIMRRRKKKIHGNIMDIAQGQIYTGQDALKLGLVDHIGSLWQLGRVLHKKYKVEGDFKLHYVKLEKKTRLGDLFDSISSLVQPFKIGSMASRLPLYLFQ